MGANGSFAADGRVDYFQYDPTQYNPYGNTGVGATGGYDGSGINPYTNGTLDAYMDPYAGGYDGMPSPSMPYAPGNVWSDAYDPYGGFSDPYAGGGFDPYGAASVDYAPGNEWSESYDPYAVGGSPAPMLPYGNNPYGGGYSGTGYGNSYTVNPFGNLSGSPYGGGGYGLLAQPISNPIVNVNITLPMPQYTSYPSFNSNNTYSGCCAPTSVYSSQYVGVVPSYCPFPMGYLPTLSCCRPY